ncbi:alpha-L-arabinofuranosidase C-terminal domain-containing protein [Oleiharenicola lentus]|uniref:alpha-L-arabinofuranosidase C-terminal domain-containing protein n=1 Tax=Oleiharenicola lentus TaxID=2508720 RepID=UPI003F665651
MRFVTPVCLALLWLSTLSPQLSAAPATLTVDLTVPGKKISPHLFGIFFEDLNYAADGGLYAELIQNRSFEYTATAQPTWNNLTAWELRVPEGGRGGLKPSSAFPLHANNPHYADFANDSATGSVSLVNAGFDGIPVRAGENYLLNFFVRQNHFARRWEDIGKQGPLPLTARLESKDGTVLAETTFTVTEREWKKFSGTLTAKATDATARLVLTLGARGGVALDEVSLFPEKTFRNRPNGLRADLAQTIADLKPRFIRFPGGCLVHGNGLGNMYRWKDTIGPIEQRRQQMNMWGYHQTVGLGYFEYFQFCEDIGAVPLPVVPAGVCCQNSGQGIGQAGLPLEEMGAYIQDVLDLIEWANGPVTSKWGAQRAAAGHPAPFNLKYLGVGNEDKITPVFYERYQLIQDAIRAKYPEIVIIGTSGPFPDGEDFDAGWKIVRELNVQMVDEHYYKSPQWFWDNLTRYDSYDRQGAQVYVGEYAAHDDKRRNTLRSALAEAAILTSLERNGDIVHLASYAPLLARRGHTQWTPDLIYFNGTDVFPTLNYTVQKLFAENRGDTYLPTKLDAPAKHLAASTVRDNATGDTIIKIVNGANAPQSVRLVLNGLKAESSTLKVSPITFAGPDANVANEDGKLAVARPQQSSLQLSADSIYELPANSLTILRIR